MKPSGVIFAALDCDADSIEDWNRWYDLEHTPPNVLLDGVMLSNRYVALPAHHAARTTSAGSPFAAGRATFLTLYTLTGDPGTAFAGMSTLREQLIDQGRMAFPEDKKAVREGDCFAGVHAAASAPTRLVSDDVPLVGHTGIVIRQRRGGSEASLARADRLAGLDFVTGVWCLESRLREGIELDIVFVDGNAADAAIAMRAAEPADPSTEVLVDAPFDRINPMHYPWADAIRNSDLPATIG
ncbi:unannotated protein [freshwater metagenome]|uniref:Unannotated protein n=1 Tax=freshwater metagenome TaxID=449393 RepID=A0A6J6IP83_9ZZZZ